MKPYIKYFLLLRYMKILSFDVGIKNLALCLLEADDKKREDEKNKNDKKHNQTNEQHNVTILDWRLLDLSPTIHYNCSYKKETKTKNKDKNKDKKNKQDIKEKNICGLNASYQDPSGNYYCKRHAKASDFLIPDTKLNLNQLNRNSVKKLNEIIELYNINVDVNENETNDIVGKNAKINKHALVSAIEAYKNKHFLTTIEKTSSKANKDSLIGLCRIMTQKLDELYNDNSKLYENIDLVLIENQIGRIAVRMKSIQGMLTQYFVGRGIPNIEYVSSMNKLKNFCEKKNMNYKERKAESIVVTRNQIELYNPKWLDFFNKFNKKDDLADCFLQALWKLNE